MKLLEALEILKKPTADAKSTKEFALLCGFTPLHLQTFLSANLRLAYPESNIDIEVGLFGDLAGNIERLQPGGRIATFVLVEWADLDPRLGIRSLGGWRSGDIADIVASARRQCKRLEQLINQAAVTNPVCLSLPTLPLPPIFFSGVSQARHEECGLREMVATSAASLSKIEQISIVNSQRLDESSAPSRRFNPKGELSTGFPYTLEHASKLAEALAALIKNAPRRKAIITDLDNTMWSGILGEAGVAGISWDLESGVHGLYQRFLDSLASAGVLIAVASKNDPKLVEQALQRDDLLLSKDGLFPVEAHWGPKSESVRRILRQWNIGASDVVFVDDSPMEVEEVKSSFPEMECVAFPSNDAFAVWELLKHLRDLFGKRTLSNEDLIRLNSIRNASVLRDLDNAADANVDKFLSSAQSNITFSLSRDRFDDRAFDLVNKTNQFNLNGRRLDRSDWEKHLQSPDAFLLTALYKDRFGPLGKIAVMLGSKQGKELRVKSWVMSCRAFSRRIEYQCLRYLFEQTGVEEIILEYIPTARNGPMRDFLQKFLGEIPSGQVSLSRKSLRTQIPTLFHQIHEAIETR